MKKRRTTLKEIQEKKGFICDMDGVSITAVVYYPEQSLL